MSGSRKTLKLDVIYTVPTVRDEQEAFFSPDGEGIVWFDTVEKAKEETGLTKVTHLMTRPED